MSFLIALPFLTTIPVKVSGKIGPKEFGRAMAWFPAVGLLLGGILALADLGTRTLLPPAVSAAITLALWVLLTGALHLDGLMDCCDGLLAARDPEKRLDILRDTHMGAFAVVGPPAHPRSHGGCLWRDQRSDRTRRAALLDDDHTSLRKLDANERNSFRPY